MYVIRNCGALNIEQIRLFHTLRITRPEMQSTSSKFDVNAIISMEMIKSRINLFCSDGCLIIIIIFFTLVHAVTTKARSILRD